MILLVSLALLIYVWNIPRSTVYNTINSVEINGPIYQQEIGDFDQFFFIFSFENKGRTPIQITKIDVEVLVNGTDYNSQMTTHSLGEINPGKSRKFHRTVLLTNAPIGFRENEVWNITAIAEIAGKSEILFSQHKKSITETKSINWTVDFLD
jgi:hypothetical protein